MYICNRFTTLKKYFFWEAIMSVDRWLHISILERNVPPPSHNYFMLIGRYKYDQEIYEVFMDSFDNLPLAALINGKFLCLHGGLSPEMRSIQDIMLVDRFREPPRCGLFCDILWSDPVEGNDHDLNYRENEVRGCSW